MPARTYTFTTPQPLTLRVRNPAGEVEITAAETAETTVEVIPRGGSGKDGAEHTRVELSGDGTRLDVEAPERRFGSAGRLTMIIRLPVGSTVDVRTASADVTCRGSLGGLEAATASGDVGADRVDGDVTISSASGDVALGAVTGSVECKTASGNMRAVSVEGGCRTTSASGDVLVGSCGGDVLARTASGDIHLRQAERGSVDVTTMSGDVKVGVRRGTMVWLDLSTLSGRTRSDLEHQDDAPGGDGEVLSISVRTKSGNITLSPSTAAAL
ncbi:MAG: DUF4097 family beta strand repeat protein [Geodermatophilaceae bacterium]|nr:DUF4097 family beta strand repeat protein [Geodermatophilaceae bacterium]MDQ3463313.1 DUF4097 domain-containing protein [Actinomycetota bacterium]